MFPDYRVKTAFQHGKGVIGKKVPFKNNKRLKKHHLQAFPQHGGPKGSIQTVLQKGIAEA